MSRKDAIESLYLKKREPVSADGDKLPERVRSGAISAMGASLKQMTDGARLATRLQEQLDKGEVVIDIDPAVIDHSPVADRIPIDIDPAFDLLVASFVENGQQVPILVRPSPSSAGRYQIAYGRRRLRAAQKLSLPVKAIVRRLSDSELIIAQGRENLEREDLSFIEKAFFAKNLEDNGCDRATIVAALCSDKADVSRYIAVARRVPERLVKLIGPAPKAGRARWMELAERLERSSDPTVSERILGEQALAQATSDVRFQTLFKSMAPKTAKREAARKDSWSTPAGKKAARIEGKNGKTSLVFEEKVVPQFASFVASRLDALFREFLENDKEKDG